MLKRILNILLITIISLSAFSQENTALPNSYLSIEKSCIDKLNESAYIHLSRSSVNAGDRLFFKAYLFNKDKSLTVNSKVLYLQLIDNKGNVVLNTRAAIKNKICISSVVVPDSLSSGVYRLIAFTNFMRNFPASTFPGALIIVTGLKYEAEIVMPVSETKTIEYVETNDKVDSNISQNTTIEDPKELNATLNKDVYNRKEKAILSLGLNANLKGKFSISVSEKIPNEYLPNNPDIVISTKCFYDNTLTDSELIGYENLNSTRKAYRNWHDSLNHQRGYELFYRPENISYLLEGKVIDKLNNEPLRKAKVILASPDSLAILKYCISDSLGKFLFPLDESFNNRKLIISVHFENDPKDYSILIDSKIVKDNSFKFSGPQQTKSLQAYYFRNKQLALFEKVYSSVNDSSKAEPFRNTVNRFYGNIDYRVYMSDYLVDFEDFNDVCKNVLPGVRYRVNKKTIKMVDLNLQEPWKENCFVLLNNIPFYDIDYISTLGSKQINYIEVSYRHIAYGDIDFYGILSIFTKDKTIIPNGHSVLLDNKVEPSYEGNKKFNSESKIAKRPDFKQLLYWTPNIELDNHTSKIEFYTSGLVSNYIIDIEGVTDNGKYISKKIEFKVQ